jgi:hypothetical protein
MNIKMKTIKIKPKIKILNFRCLSLCLPHISETIGDTILQTGSFMTNTMEKHIQIRLTINKTKVRSGKQDHSQV